MTVRFIMTENNKEMMDNRLTLFIVRTILFLSVQLPCHKVSAQFPSQNYVMSELLLDRVGSRRVSTTKVYDGLGRPGMEVTTGLGSSGRNVYTLQEYNSRGEVEKSWLPVAGSSQVQDISVSDIACLSFLTYSDSKAYTYNAYDALGRNVSTQTAGEPWHISGKAKTVEYGTNGENTVKHYVATGSPKYSLTQDGYYKKGVLFREKNTDEDGKSVETYKDLMGNKVLERRNGNNDTYFVYDASMRLRFVLSPEYQQSGYKDRYAYEYRYDDRGDVVKKILPGCGYVQYWYDTADRLAFMQDATLREQGLYRFFLYERYGRLAIQGVCSGCIRKPSHNVATLTSGSGVCGSGYEMELPQNISGMMIETVNYYDSYGFLNIPDFATLGMSSAQHDNIPCPYVKQTGKMQMSSSGEKLVSAIFYNGRGQPSTIVKTYAGKRLTESQFTYSFTDKPEETRTNEYYTGNGNRTLLASIVEHRKYSEVTDNLLSVSLTVNGKEETIQQFEYDDLGRIKSVTRGGSAGAVSYDYNLHGWTTNIGSKDFHEELHYTDGTGTPCYNGNISSQLWSTSDYGQVRGYRFVYDNLDRLKEAVYGETPSLSDKQNRYNEKVLEYTGNGAMKRFQRRGRKDDGEYGKIDNLNIKLNGNQLLSVTDDALPANKYSSFNFIDGSNEQVEYEYNGVGALTKDLNRGIAVSYDNLNNTRLIDFKGGNSITYNYLSDGTLLSKHYGSQFGSGNKARSFAESKNVYTDSDMSDRTIADTLVQKPDFSGSDMMWDGPADVFVVGETEYSGNIIYSNGNIDKVLFPGGYCTFSKAKSDEPIFHYYTQDHLGNNRIVTNEDGTVEQIVHYYPFGGTFNDAGLNAGLQHYKYNGKELDRIGGLNTYDYGARQYFSALPVWDRIDPKCEEDYGISLYAYCRNNPIKMLDKDGKRPGDFFLTMDAAAIDFGLFYNDNSIRENREYGTFIYRVTNKKGVSG